MKTILFTFAAVALMGGAASAHDSDAYITLIPEKQVSATTNKQATDATIVGAGAEADRSAVKLIDNLTEKLYFERKKRWEKEHESLVSK